MSRWRDFFGIFAFAGFAALVTVGALAQQRPATAPLPVPPPQAARAPEPAPLPWAGGPNAQIMGSRVARSDSGNLPARRLGLGRLATPAEIAGWDIDIRPDGHGLPEGRGTAKAGEELYIAQCASCHGDFGESAGRWPILAGGAGTLNHADPVKSIGSFWPYATTLLDYIHRTMPFGNAQSLTWDETYAITAYVLYVNDVITDTDFELNRETIRTLTMPNAGGFFPDDRETAERHFWRGEPCMANCAAGAARITGRARALDVTPETANRPRSE